MSLLIGTGILTEQAFQNGSSTNHQKKCWKDIRIVAGSFFTATEDLDKTPAFVPRILKSAASNICSCPVRMFCHTHFAEEQELLMPLAPSATTGNWMEPLRKTRTAPDLTQFFYTQNSCSSGGKACYIFLLQTEACKLFGRHTMESSRATNWHSSHTRHSQGPESPPLPSACTSLAPFERMHFCKGYCNDVKCDSGALARMTLLGAAARRISDQNPTGSFWAYAKQLCCVMRIALQQGFSRVLAAGFLMSAEPRL